jgi:hypothetical protein
VVLDDWLAVRGAAAGPLFTRIQTGGPVGDQAGRLTSQAIYHLMKVRGRRPSLPPSARTIYGAPAFQPPRCRHRQCHRRGHRRPQQRADNGPLRPAWGARHRQGEWISTGFVESMVNYVVSKRMVKRQQMQWTPAGAHLLLQVRTQVLNDTWETTVRSWYPGFRPEQVQQTRAQSAA